MSDAPQSAASRAAEYARRTLTREEAAAYLSAPITEAERNAVLALVRWFRRRYPTGADRLAYVRSAYRRWTANRARSAID